VEHLAEDAGIIVAELTNNAVQHAFGGFDLVLLLRRNLPHIQVIDPDPRVPVFPISSIAEDGLPEVDKLGGLGLYLVLGISAACGVAVRPAARSSGRRCESERQRVASGSGVAQGVDDAGDMAPGGPLSAFGTTSAQLVDDREVLRQRHLRTAGPKSQPELVADVAGAQIAEHLGGDRLGGDLADPVVQPRVQLRVDHHLALADRFGHAAAQFAQFGGLGVGDALGRLGRTVPFDHHAYLGDGDRFLDANRADAGADVGDPLDQSSVRQVDQRRSDDASAGVVHRGQLGLDQALSRGELAGQDRRPDALRDRR